MADEQSLGALFEQSAAIMARLRGPDGCPWDREQTPETIRKYTLEETYEVLDAIERKDWANLSEELGDLLLQVLFYAEIATEAGHFQLAQVLAGLNRKLIRRHPHVFGEQASAEAGNRAGDLLDVGLGNARGAAGRVVANWNAIKRLEKKHQPPVEGAGSPIELLHAGSLADVARSQPALTEAAKLGSAAARVGFDWPDAQGLLAKVREEAAEVEAELAAGDDPGARARLADEVGDLLFTAVQLARHVKIDAEMALRDANAKFRRRFEKMEQSSPRRLEDLSPEQLEQSWAAAKLAMRDPAR